MIQKSWAYVYKYIAVVTNIEFDDITGRFPNNPEAVQILKDLLERLPDLRYRKSVYMMDQSPVKPLSELLVNADDYILPIE